jgi:hypothetical protein
MVAKPGSRVSSLQGYLEKPTATFNMAEVILV